VTRRSSARARWSTSSPSSGGRRDARPPTCSTASTRSSRRVERQRRGRRLGEPGPRAGGAPALTPTDRR
jgi:hypothetical protein